MEHRHQYGRARDLKRGCKLAASAALICAFLVQGVLADPAVTPGSEALARAYYTRIAKELKFDLTPGQTRLDSLLAFTGYPVSGAKLQSLDPAILMNPTSASSPTNGLGLQLRGLNGATLRDGDILATRFFAPKIVNVDTAKPIPGWRKLIRLRARPDSPAARVGVASVIILFNFLASGDQPFSGPSVNTQVMLLAPASKDRLFWMDFNPDGTLGLRLNASFDAADLPNGGTRDYFVPDGCNACHGSPGNFAPPMVNYLDTDHWFDRLDNDFAFLKAAATPLLFDAQTNDPSQASFAAAFDVIRRFNEEALFQNVTVRPQQTFEAEAARTWLRLHSQSDDHFPPTARGFSLNGKPTWQPSEAEGLGRLDQYCFRCHGSVHFSIFDRPTVVEKAGIMRQRILPGAQQAKVSGFKMPPDRVLAPSEVQALDDFLKNLK